MQDDKFSLITQFPSLNDYEDYARSEFEKSRPKPPNAEFQPKPQPLSTPIGGNAGKVTIKTRKGRRISFAVQWQKALIDASLTVDEAYELLDLLQDFLQDYETYERHIEKEQALSFWLQDRDIVLEAARTQWREQWAQYCEANGILFCSECGQMEVLEPGEVCEWCKGQAELDADRPEARSHQLWCADCGQWLEEAYTACPHCSKAGE